MPLSEYASIVHSGLSLLKISSFRINFLGLLYEVIVGPAIPRSHVTIKFLVFFSAHLANIYYAAVVLTSHKLVPIFCLTRLHT